MEGGGARLREVVGLRIAQAHVDYGLHAVVSTREQIAELDRYVNDFGMTSSKFFMSFRGEEVDSHHALRELGLAPLELLPKEGLALMNGTSMTTALACLSWHRARRLARLASTLTAMTSIAIKGNASRTRR